MEIELRQTCSACPEQYDAFYNGVEVGYLRLRHGYFRAECMGETVYQSQVTGDGCFVSSELAAYLSFAKKAITKKLYEEGQIEFGEYVHLLEQEVDYSEFVKSLTADLIGCRYVCNGTESFVVFYNLTDGIGEKVYERLNSTTLLIEDLDNYCLLNLVEITSL